MTLGLSQPDTGRPEGMDSGNTLASPGSILEPLAWMASPLFEMIRCDPALAPGLLALDQCHLHLLALALARDPDHFRRAIVTVSLGTPIRSMLPALGLSDMADSVESVLQRLPQTILPESGYRALLRLLADSMGVNILPGQAGLDERFLENLAALPTQLLTPPIALALDRTPGSGRLLPDWIQLVAQRQRDTNPEQVTEHLRTARSGRELSARISGLIEGLTETNIQPPPTIANARRLDSVAEIRWMARICSVQRQHNFALTVLRSTLWYIWSTERNPLICELAHVPGYGWLFNGFVAGHQPVPDLDFLLNVQSVFKANGLPCRRIAELSASMLANLDRAMTSETP